MNRKQMVYRLISRLLQYPKEEWILNAVWEEVALIPVKSVREPLVKFLTYIEESPYTELCKNYVVTFEFSETPMNLTNTVYKGKPERQEALAWFLQEFHKTSIELVAEELRDYLPLILELAAIAPEDQIDTILRLHKRSIDSLQLEFQEMNSAYRYLIEACMENMVIGDEHEDEKVS